MTAIGRDEAMTALESACACEHAALVEQRRLTEQARSCAATLEAENAALRALLHVVYHRKSESGRRYSAVACDVADDAVLDFIYTGSLSADALSLAASLLAES